MKKPIFWFLAGWALVCAGCASKPELIANSKGYRYDDEATYVHNVKNPPAPPWRPLDEEKDGYYFVTGMHIPEDKQITEKRELSLEAAHDKAKMSAMRGIAAHVGVEIKSKSAGKEKVSGGRVTEEFSSETWEQMGAYLEGVETVEFYYEERMKKHKKESIKYYCYWVRYKISEANIEKARKANADEKSGETRQQERFKTLAAEYEKIIAAFETPPYPDGDLFDKLHTDLMEIQFDLKSLVYYQKNPTDAYTTLTEQVDAALKNHDITQRHKNEIAALEKQIHEMTDKLNNTNTDLAASEAARKAVEEIMLKMFQEIQNKLDGIRETIGTQGPDGKPAGLSALSNQLEELQNRLNTVEQYLSAQDANGSNYIDPTEFNSLAEQVQTLQTQSAGITVNAKRRRIPVSDSASVWAIPVSNQDYYSFSPDKIAYLTDGKPGWLEQPITVTAPYQDPFEYCNLLSRSAGYLPVYKKSGETYQLTGRSGYRLPTFQELAAAATHQVVNQSALIEFKWITHDAALNKNIDIVYYKRSRIQSELFPTNAPGNISFMVVLDGED